jgi:hypothetical protein
MCPGEQAGMQASTPRTVLGTKATPGLPLRPLQPQRKVAAQVSDNRTTKEAGMLEMEPRLGKGTSGSQALEKRDLWASPSPLLPQPQGG